MLQWVHVCMLLCSLFHEEELEETVDEEEKVGDGDESRTRGRLADCLGDSARGERGGWGLYRPKAWGREASWGEGHGRRTLRSSTCISSSSGREVRFAA